jgi:hypothetical protein
MYRARRWTVVLVVFVTTLVAGFARFDGDGAATPSAVVSLAPVDEDDEEADAAQALVYFRMFSDFIDEIARSDIGPVPALPPFNQLPPLPTELLPSEADGTEG